MLYGIIFKMSQVLSNVFNRPVILEIPHFASICDNQREIVILRSEKGDIWQEHTLEANKDAIQQVLNQSFSGEELNQLEDLHTSRITRILTNDFPYYFALISRMKQDVQVIGPEGGTINSSTVANVHASFPQNALMKNIRVGLQAQFIDPVIATKLLGMIPRLKCSFSNVYSSANISSW